MQTELTSSPLESRRFGLSMARWRGDRMDPARLAAAVYDQRLDLAVIRLPSREAHQIHRLAEFGLPPRHADTLVYYEQRLPTHKPLELRNSDLVFRLASHEDGPALEAMVRACFHDYRSHYHSNPHLDRDAILDGYVEWAHQHVGAPDCLTWLACKAGVPIAFACGRVADSDGYGEGVLYGVHPAHAGSGIYADLIRFSLSEFERIGLGRMRVSTQITNLAVQKVWSREGFHLAESWETFHLHAWLSAGEAMVDREVMFSTAQVEAFGAVSGDRNPIHFDADAARQAGFDSSISHGMLAAAELSKIIGTEFPGPGTLFLRTEFVFRAPLYPERRYRLQLRFPHGMPARGRGLAIASIEASDDTLCVYARCELLRR